MDFGVVIYLTATSDRVHCFQYLWFDPGKDTPRLYGTVFPPGHRALATTPRRVEAMTTFRQHPRVGRI